MNEQKEIGKKIRTLRVRHLGLTQVEFSKAIGVCPATVVKWEAGRHEPYNNNLKAIKDVFGFDVEVLTPMDKWTPGQNGATNVNP